jgi:hypothetical protein
MSRPTSFRRNVALATAALAVWSTAAADFELSDPQGRRILLKDDGTWRYLDSAKGGAQDTAKGGAQETAVLRLDGKSERGSSCRFAITLVNNLPYEIESFVPSFSAYRASGVVYDTVSIPRSFNSLKTGNSQSREFEVHGIKCGEIERVQVVGGDRCSMGNLSRFSDAKGECLARISVTPSDLVRFDK